MSGSTLTDVVVRAATTSDVAAVTALEQRCFADPWPRSAFAVLPANPNAFFGVATVAGALAGYVVGWHVMNEAELANLAVEPAVRRSGVGGRLLDAMLDDAGRRAIDAIFLEVRESNEAARRLYASRGFAEVGRRKRYYHRPDEDALILRRDRLMQAFGGRTARNGNR